MKNHRIISFERDFNFYVKRAFKHMDIGNIKRALNYLNRASYINPKDISVQFNRAGIMSEIGNLEESNKVLKNIVENIDSSMGECYFGIGCNYFQMDKMKEAKKYFNKYIEKFPKGEYSEEATELIELIDEVFIDNREKSYIDPIYDQVRVLIDNKKYTKAEKKIDELLLKDPKDIKALILQSILFYYRNDIDKALYYGQQAYELDNKDIETQCNMLIIYDKLNREEDLKQLSLNLISNDYQSIDELYKIAITFGQLKKHYYCYRVFKELIGIFPENILFLHLAALTFYNQKIFKGAAYYWQDILDIDPDNLIALKYLDLIDVLKEKPRLFNEEQYRYRLPKYYHNQFKKEIRNITISSKEQISKEWESNQHFRAKILWSLKQDDSSLLTKTLEVLKNIDGSEAIYLIEDFLYNHRRKSKAREKAKEILSQLQEQQGVLIDYNQSKTVYHIKALATYIIGVFEINGKKQAELYNTIYNTLLGESEIISDNWGSQLLAAIEYCYRSRYNKSVSYKTVSQKHNVPQKEIITRVEIANQILDLIINSVDV